MSTDDLPADKPKSRRGGKRIGAGRKAKGSTSPSLVGGIDLQSVLAAPVPDEIESVARRHARTAIEALQKQLLFGQSESARVNAANAILDRGFGRPSVDVGGDAMLPFFGLAPDRTTSQEIRQEARRHAQLAIEVLNKIAGHGASESARVMAAKSLLDRGLGTVAAAKIGTEELPVRPLGKKEEAAIAAETAGSGTEWGNDLSPLTGSTLN